ncbi:MAG: hypothetical protein WC869_08215 [Phycisphaerae bacterium]|jgi:hypothetical protein
MSPTRPPNYKTRKAALPDAHAKSSNEAHHESKGADPRYEKQRAAKAALETAPPLDANSLPLVEARKVARLTRQLHQPGDVVAHLSMAAGMSHPARIGTRLGFVYWTDPSNPAFLARAKIISVGAMRIGTTIYCLGIAPPMVDVYLCLDRKVWRYPQARLSRAPSPELRQWARHDQPRAVAYADAITREVAAQITPLPERDLWEQATRQYSMLVRAAVQDRVHDAAQSGYIRTPAMFAASVSKHWNARSLLAPRYPTIQHALYVALVLGLPAPRAGGLVSLACLLEYGVPLIPASEAARIAGHAAGLLARLVPSWWSESYLHDWHATGTLEDVLAAQMQRALRIAYTRGTQVRSEPAPDVEPADEGEAWVDNARDACDTIPARSCDDSEE